MRNEESFTETMVMIGAGLVAGAWVLSNFDSVWRGVTTWLTERGVLTLEGVIWHVPNATGAAGLDGGRLAIAGALALVGLAAAVHTVRRRMRRPISEPELQ